jgi:universal stress protein A
VTLEFRKIVLATDFSPSAARAAEVARQLATSLASQVAVLHVMPSPSDYRSYGLSPETIAQIQADLRAGLDAKLAEMAALLPGLTPPPTRHVRDGTPWREVCAFAAETGADLIVLGTRGHTGFKHLVLGSTAERVVRSAPCAVLTVREREEEEEQNE